MSNDASQQSLIGQQIAHYRIAGQLGAGGMGVVYRALDTRLDRHVALKFLPPHLSADSRRKARFLQEAKTAGALDHVNVGTLYGIEETPDGQMFLVMACYDGQPLSSLLRQGRLPLMRALNIAQQIARGLAAAHRQGVIHRDIKPSNVLVTSDGVVKIVDFGLARFTQGEHLTEAGATAGTAAYMSPEQVKGEDVDHRTDIWSLGVVLCEMLSGHLPFQGENTHSLLYKVVHEPPALSESEIPDQFSEVLRKALAKNRAERYSRAEDLARDLEAAEAGLPVAENTRTVTSHWSPSNLALRSQPPDTNLTRSAFSARKILWGLPFVVVLAVIALVPGWREGSLEWFRPGPANGPKHIVVLPFKNIGNDPANAALCDGLTEVLTGRLTGLEQGAPTLWVIPSSEVRRRK
ncbi:MAG: serine/threonine-protein kinase, partial [Acidobacteriota bacterium]|nr:serine/threonine-protein kinase [Acidobacteriota bacterium]